MAVILAFDVIALSIARILAMSKRSAGGLRIAPPQQPNLPIFQFITEWVTVTRRSLPPHSLSA
jgi:hypothetical protein